MLKLVHSRVKSEAPTSAAASQDNSKNGDIAKPSSQGKPSKKNAVAKVNAQERLQQERGSPRVNIEEVLRLTGGSAANGDNSDPVVFQGLAETQMRAYIAHYGFERMPLTYGELQGLLDYCDDLDSITGRYMFTSELERKLWQSDYSVWRKHRPHMFPAAELYAAGDLDALKALHRREDTLTKIGKMFREFE